MTAIHIYQTNRFSNISLCKKCGLCIKSMVHWTFNQLLNYIKLKSASHLCCHKESGWYQLRSRLKCRWAGKVASSPGPGWRNMLSCWYWEWGCQNHTLHLELIVTCYRLVLEDSNLTQMTINYCCYIINCYMTLRNWWVKIHFLTSSRNHIDTE